MSAFNKWFDTFLEEKHPDHAMWEIEGASGINFIDSEIVIEHIKIASPQEQEKIKETLVMIDFKNGDVNHYFKHLAGALVR